MLAFYAKSRGRRPIWQGIRSQFYDVEGEVPYGWCAKCGMECYLPGQVLCLSCEEKEKKLWKTQIVTLAEDAPECQILGSARTKNVAIGNGGF